MEDFSKRITEAVEDSLLAAIRKGEWLRIDYQSRLAVPMADLRKVYEGIDMQRIVDGVRLRVEQHITDSIMNAMAQEVATDVKRILSNQELREDIRSVVRSKLREFCKAGQ